MRYSQGVFFVLYGALPLEQNPAQMVPHPHIQTFCALVEVSRLLLLAVQG